jgi:hypothetical protein
MSARLKRNPCCWFHFTDMYSTRQSANKALRRLVDQGVAEVIGQIPTRGEGDLCLVYAAVGSPRWRTQQLRHDVIGTTLILHLGLPYKRGNDVNPALEPDFETYGGRKVNWEIHTGLTATYARVKEERFPLYADCADPTIWITCGLWNTKQTTQSERLRTLAVGMPNMWFAALSDLRKNGLATPLLNCNDDVRLVQELCLKPTTLESSSPEEW